MNKYGTAAVNATQILNNRAVQTPLDAWNQTTIELFGANTPAQRKGCPKNAFLGLCEEGLVRGISKGNYTYKSDSLNKTYAVEAVRLLRGNPELANDRNSLWKEVMQGVKKSHNSQMDVVLALWASGQII
ncbi:MULTISPECIES: DUF6979 family protein [Paenibacillus]|uniref:SLH domain-containing protein n=1 Tax=Paenibacillus borealis TaxID=160799 RepID=A0ABX3HU74_PAEBO|nr:hypothetical protein [Paenibacillus borealis]OMD53687.1 hypothetical protein BSK56_00640 [Paenibacillus borealis]